jgi:hypothetical protein
MQLLELKLWFLGAIALGTFCAAFFFLRFRKLTRDRLFMFFALAFFVEGISRILMAISALSSEEHPAIYLLRFISYGFIVWGIVDKNRQTGA